MAKKGRIDDALDDLNRAVKLRADFQPARLNRGVVYWLKKDTDAALTDFDAVLEAPADKRLIQAAYYRGQVKLSLRKTKEALADFDLVVKENPSFAPVYLERAPILFATSNAAQGLGDLNTYLALVTGKEVDLDSGEACFRRGRMLRRFALKIGGKARTATLELAQKELQKAVGQDAASASVYDELGAICDLLGQRERAIESYSAGIGRAPDNISLREKRGWAYAIDPGQFELAAADFRTTFELAAKNPVERRDQASAHSGLGFVHACRGEEGAANREAILALAQQKQEGHWHVHLNVATIYAELSKGKEDQADDYKKQAIAILQIAAYLAKEAGADRKLLQQMQNEPALDPVNGSAEFKDLLDSLKPKT